MKHVYKLLVEDGLPETDYTREEFEPIDGSFESFEITDTSDDGGTKSLGGELNIGREVTTSNPPTQVRRKRLGKAIPMADFISAPRGAVFISDRVKEIIESFEPNVHQFFPMTVSHRGQEIGPLNYLIIGSRLDSLDAEACYPPIPTGARIWKRDRKNPAQNKIVVSAAAIEGKHLWHDQRVIGLRMISPELMAAFMEADVKGLRDAKPFEVL